MFTSILRALPGNLGPTTLNRYFEAESSPAGARKVTWDTGHSAWIADQQRPMD